jgi:hypothetical protein
MIVQLRKLRGVLSIGVTWGIAFAAVSAGLVLVVGMFRPEDIDAGEGPIRAGAILGGVGFLSGVGFGVLLAVAESRRPIHGIALSRAAMWGALASAVFPLLTGRQDQVFMLCPIGAVVALALAAIARKAERHGSRPPRGLRDVLFACVLTSVRDVVRPPARSD